jgi:hypothetical protein
MMPAMSLKAGVTIASNLADPIAALWAHGINQNAVFLTQLLAGLPNVSWAGLVPWPGQDGAHSLAQMFGLNMAPLELALDDLDVLIELGVRADAGAMTRFRARGGKLVSYMAGNAMVMNFEAVANKTGYGEVLNHPGYDAVWITPQHWRTNHSYCRMTRSARVEEAPHLWSPEPLTRLRAAFGRPFAPRRKPPFRIGIFEPNVNVVKTFHYPLLVCEEAFRARPDLIDRVLMFGALPLKDNAHFKEFTGTFELARQGRLFAEDRHPLASVLGEHVDAVVTHQWENELNYLYWDVLQSGVPLVHNSDAIKDAGYHYPGFDPQAGAQVLIQALEGVDGPPQPCSQDKAIVWRYHLQNPAVRQRYTELLTQLGSGRIS